MTDLTHPLRSTFSKRSAWILVAGFALAVLAYWPSLRGGFVFDDYPNIVGNREVQISSLDWESLKQAAWSSPSRVLRRPLAMLSFGVDYYLGQGLDPFRMKVVNLAIHLLNGLLLFGVLRTLLRQKPFSEDHADLLGALVASAWLLAPINFTAVAYVVQRMESLCQLFVLAGLWGYASARDRMQHNRTGALRAALSLILGTGLGALAKESAVMLPLYALLAEALVFRFQSGDSRLDRRILALHGIVSLLPLCIAAAIMVPPLLQPSAYAGRDFTLAERLYTEARILVHYVYWTVLPQPRLLGMYHDNIALSRGLLSPPTTLASIALLFGLGIAAVLLRRRRPFFALGILWYLAAHLLTGTVIPLELVFEHRNYFASIGVLLAVFDLLLPSHAPSFPRAKATASVALLVLYAGVTFARSIEWRHPLEFALAEAQKNPNSPRAVYELGSTYAVLSGYKPDSPLIEMAIDTFDRAARLPNSGALSDEGRVLIDSRTGRTTPAQVWERLRARLSSRPLAASDVTALDSLSRCVIEELCAIPQDEMVATFAAALSHHTPDVKVLGIYANYAYNVLDDMELALRLTRQAIQLAPRELNPRRNLLFLLLRSGQIDDAREAYVEIRKIFPEVDQNPEFRQLSK